jgi:hypothetical protein
MFCRPAWFVLAGWLAAVGLLSADPALAGPAGGQDLVQLGQRVEARVAELRQLPVRKPIRWQITSKDKVRAYVKATMAQQYQPGELDNEGLAMRALGLLPADLEYGPFVLGLLEEQVGGYYDPKQEVFFLADWIAPALQETIIAHELCHALQDQHFDIDAFIERVPGNSDAMLARAALVEGEATLVMMQYAMRGSGLELDPAMIDLGGPLGDVFMSLSAAQFPEFAKAPRALRESLLFPYLKGLGFVAHGRKRGGWKAIDRVYADLPASSEQVLHPAKYFELRDEPSAIALGFCDGLVPDGWEPIFEDVLGEFMLGMLLDSLGARDEEERAAAGWDGDRLRVYRQGDRLAWLDWSIWDTEEDAIEFAAALAKTVPKKKAGFALQPLGKEPIMRWVHPDGRSVLIGRAGSRVLAIDGFAGEVAGRLWAAAVAQP